MIFNGFQWFFMGFSTMFNGFRAMCGSELRPSPASAAPGAPEPPCQAPWARDAACRRGAMAARRPSDARGMAMKKAQTEPAKKAEAKPKGQAPVRRRPSGGPSLERKLRLGPGDLYTGENTVPT